MDTNSDPPLNRLRRNFTQKTIRKRGRNWESIRRPPQQRQKRAAEPNLQYLRRAAEFYQQERRRGATAQQPIARRTITYSKRERRRRPPPGIRKIPAPFSKRVAVTDAEAVKPISTKTTKKPTTSTKTSNMTKIIHSTSKSTACWLYYYDFLSLRNE